MLYLPRFLRLASRPSPRRRHQRLTRLGSSSDWLVTVSGVQLADRRVRHAGMFGEIALRPTARGTRPFHLANGRLLLLPSHRIQRPRIRACDVMGKKPISQSCLLYRV